MKKQTITNNNKDILNNKYVKLCLRIIKECNLYDQKKIDYYRFRTINRHYPIKNPITSIFNIPNMLLSADITLMEYKQINKLYFEAVKSDFYSKLIKKIYKSNIAKLSNEDKNKLKKNAQKIKKDTFHIMKNKYNTWIGIEVERIMIISMKSAFAKYKIKYKGNLLNLAQQTKYIPC